MSDEPEVEVLSESIDLDERQPVEHRFNMIIGNQLTCTLHDACTSITVSPTAVLEPNSKGELELVEKGV